MIWDHLGNLDAALKAASRGITTILVGNGVTVKVEPTTEPFAQLKRAARRASTYAPQFPTSFPAGKGNQDGHSPGRRGPALKALREARLDADVGSETTKHPSKNRVSQDLLSSTVVSLPAPAKGTA